MVASSAAKKASQEDWTPARIKYELHTAGWTLAALADRDGLNRSTLSTIFQRGSPKGAKRIADAIGVAPPVIWPSRWNPDGTPKPRGAHVLNHTARERARNGKPAAAAGNVAVGG